LKHTTSGLSESPAQLLLGRRWNSSLSMISLALESFRDAQEKKTLVKQHAD